MHDGWMKLSAGFVGFYVRCSIASALGDERNSFAGSTGRLAGLLA
jgi:hypothetical protein